MSTKTSIRFLFGHRAIRLYMDNTLKDRDMDMDVFDVLLTITLVSEHTDTDTVKIATVRGFFKNYFKDITIRKFNKVLDILHEEGYIFINTLKTVTLNKLGLQFINHFYEDVFNFERTALRPLYKVITSGIIGKEGELIHKDNIKKKRNPYNPYVGVFRLQGHLFGAYVKINQKEVMVGAYPKPLDAARARDKYIKDNNLKITKSLKY